MAFKGLRQTKTKNVMTAIKGTAMAAPPTATLSFAATAVLSWVNLVMMATGMTAMTAPTPVVRASSTWTNLSVMAVRSMNTVSYVAGEKITGGK